jgi:serine/threonine protein phosphatase PrpC
LKLNVKHGVNPAGGHATEDVVAAMVHPQNPKYWIAALADGQGGQAGGAEAARIAVNEAMRQAAALPLDQLQNTRLGSKLETRRI